MYTRTLRFRNFFIFLLIDNSYSQKNTVTEPILISISQDVLIISVTEITDGGKYTRSKYEHIKHSFIFLEKKYI